MIKRNLALTAVALAALSFAVAPAFAEEDASKGGPRAEKFEKRGHEMFEKTDTNKDGFLSREEMEASHKERMDAMFEKTDTDKDGRLSPEELKKGRESMREKYRERFEKRKEMREEHHGDGQNDD